MVLSCSAIPAASHAFVCVDQLLIAFCRVERALMHDPSIRRELMNQTISTRCVDAMPGQLHD